MGAGVDDDLQSVRMRVPDAGHRTSDGSAQGAGRGLAAEGTRPIVPGIEENLHDSMVSKKGGRINETE